jgi:FkbM family methyltransferase
MNLVQSLKYYYRKDKWNGVAFLIKARFYQRIFKKIRFASWHYFLDPYRVITKRYEMGFTPINDDFKKFGNYFLFNREPIDPKSIIYSLGVLNNTSFDQCVADELGSQVFLFDPSIIATRHIEAIAHPKFVFQEVAIWNENTSMTFSTPTYGGSPSMIFSHPGRQFVAQCKTLDTVMAELGHTHINIMKLDVEGAAPAILNFMLDSSIYPDQVIVEIERKKNRSVTDFLSFFQETDSLVSRFQNAGYKVFRMPRDEYKYFSLELIFVRGLND